MKEKKQDHIVRSKNFIHLLQVYSPYKHTLYKTEMNNGLTNLFFFPQVDRFLFNT